MTLRQYLVVMILGTIFCWAAWGVVILNVDPYQSDNVGFLFFYISLFLALLGSFSLIDFLLRWFFSKSDEPIFRFVKKSFRDAFLISVFAIAVFYLQAHSYLKLWNLAVLAGCFLLYVLLTYSINISKNEPKNTNT